MKEAKKLHVEARVSEGPCGLEEIQKFQDYLGPKGYRIIVAETVRGGVIFKGDTFQEAEKTMALVKSVYVDDENVEKAYYDFRAEKRSAQASAHPLSQAQGRLFCVLTCLFVAGVLSEMHEVRTFAPCKSSLFDMFAFFVA